MSCRLVLQDLHAQHFQEFLLPESGHERSAYLLFSQVNIKADPWTGQPSQRFLSYEVVPVDEGEVVSSSAQHITWATQSFVNVLKRAHDKGLVVALVHNHPGGLAEFSEQDDRNEADLMQLAQNRNGPEVSLLSLVLMPNQRWIGRLWENLTDVRPLDLIQVVGDRISLHYPDRGQGQPSAILNRQALAFGDVLNQDLAQLRVGIVGVGGTGSAVAMLAARLGIRKFVLFDQDVVEATNLNRLHGATLEDAECAHPKVEVVARLMEALGLGIDVQTQQKWVNDRDCRDALRSCDVVFGCTDDHAGRLVLNRYAYYYATPVIDLGLAIEVSNAEIPEIQALDGRVTVLQPGYPCLLCRDVINPTIARDELLKQQHPEQYESRKAEAYVQGEGNPSPSVVLFTTDVANMALQELVHRLQGFRGRESLTKQRVRKFKLMNDRSQGRESKAYCSVCGCSDHWAMGDTDPFLGLLE